MFLYSWHLLRENYFLSSLSLFFAGQDITHFYTRNKWCTCVVPSEWNKGKKTVFSNYLFPTVKWLASFKFQHSLAKIAFNFHVGQDLNCWQSGKNSRVSSWWFDIRLVTTVLFVCFFSKWGQTHWQLTYKVRHFCLTI